MSIEIEKIQAYYIHLLKLCGVETTVKQIREWIVMASLAESLANPSNQKGIPIEDAKKIYFSHYKAMNVPFFLRFTVLAMNYGYELEAVFRNDGDLLPPSFCGSLPIGSMNAQAILTPDGALLLVNDGLFVVAERALRLLSYDNDFFNMFPKSIHEELALREKDLIKNEGMPERKILPREKIAKELAKLILSLVVNLDPAKVPMVPQQDSEMINGLLSHYLIGIELFAVAHEYSHLYLGHLNGKSKTLLKSSAGMLNVVLKSWDEELIADEVAYNLMSGIIELRGLSKKEDMPFATMQVFDPFFGPAFSFAPVFFFLLDELYNLIGRKVLDKSRSQILSSHPPSEMRIKACLKSRIDLLNMIEKKYSPETADTLEGILIEPSLWVLKWYSEMEEMVLHFIDQIQQ